MTTLAACPRVIASRAVAARIGMLPLVATILLAACSGGGESETPASTPTAEATPVVSVTVAPTARATSAATAARATPPADLYDIGTEVTDLDQRIVKESVAAARDYVARQNIDLGANVQVSVHAAFGPSNPTCFSGGVLRVIVNTNCPVFQGASDTTKRKQVGYAFFRVVQFNLAGLNDASKLGPNWLFAGTAEYFGNRVIVSQQLSTDDATTKCELWTLEHGPARPALEQTNPSSDGSVGLSELAVELLVRNSGGMSAIVNYYASFKGPSGDDTNWQEKFAASFGRDVTTFYAEFATYRSTAKSGLTDNPCP